MENEGEVKGRYSSFLDQSIDQLKCDGTRNRGLNRLFNIMNVTMMRTKNDN